MIQNILNQTKYFIQHNSDFTMYSIFIFVFIFFILNQYINHNRLSLYEIYSSFFGAMSALIVVYFGFNPVAISFAIFSYILYYVAKNLEKIKRNSSLDIRNLSSFLNPKNIENGSRWSFLPTLKHKMPKRKNSFFLDHPRLFNQTKAKLLCHIPKSVTNQKLYIKATDFQKVVLAVGSMGSGKSVFIQNILYQNRNFEYFDRQIVHDYFGEFASKFYDKKRDYIYNPFDKNSVYIDIWEEMKYDKYYGSIYMINMFSELINGTGEAKNKDAIWEQFSGFEIDKMMLEIHDRYQSLSSTQKWEKLLEYIDNYQKNNRDNRTKQSISIYLNLLTKTIKILLWQSKDEDILHLSLHNFLHRERASLFLTKSGGSIDVLRILQVGVFGLYADILKKKTVNNDSLCLLVLDEFLSLNFEKETRKTLFTALRKRGNAMICGMQHLDPNDPDIKLAETSTFMTLIFRTTGSATIKFLVDSYGAVEFLHYTITNNKTNVTKSKTNFIQANFIKERFDYTHLTMIPELQVYYLGYTPDPKLPNIHPEFEKKDDDDLKLYEDSQKVFSDIEIEELYQKSLIAMEDPIKYSNFIRENNLEGVDLKKLFKDFV